MAGNNTRTPSHRRLSQFVHYIRPDKDSRAEIKERGKKVWDNVTKNAEEDGLIISSKPGAGSFATHTGLIRMFRGNTEVDSQDIDQPFVIEPETVDGETLDELLQRFKGYVEKSYPNSEVKETKSSIKLKFDDKTKFDIVPMLKAGDDKQIIIRSNNERVETSVRKHVKFIKTRNASSNEISGRVRFNECIRLLKWWRDIQAQESYYLSGDDAPPSFLINLLAAHAYDKLSVQETYAETFLQWFGYLAHAIEQREIILFTDYNSSVADNGDEWSVIDPVNPENNIVKKWSSTKINELAKWFSESRDTWSRILRYDKEKSESQSLEQLIILFGNPIKNNTE